MAPCLQELCVLTNLHICLQPPVSGYLLSPPRSAAVLPAVYWARCSLHHPAVRKGQQQLHDAIHEWCLIHLSYLASVEMLVIPVDKMFFTNVLLSDYKVLGFPCIDVSNLMNLLNLCLAIICDAQMSNWVCKKHYCC